MSPIASIASADILASAEPEVIAAWQQLPGHIQAVAAIGEVARQFGPRIGMFPMIVEYALGDGYRLDDRALWCCDGPG